MLYEDEYNFQIVNKNITVIGGGVIGASWVALFLAKGMNVTVNDPMLNIEKMLEHIKNEEPSLLKLGYNKIDTEKIIFENNLEKAVVNADFIQENGPERLDFKVDLWAKIEKVAPITTLFFSSSSGIVATKQAMKLKHPERLIIGHPFNPPHLMPLVEIVPGEKTSEETISKAIKFYNSLGKVTLTIKKEIPGFVANRLQSAIFKECVYLVQQGIVTIKELDKIMTNSLGIRWATAGPFLSFHLGGGSGGFEHFIEHFSLAMENAWKDQASRDVHFDEETKSILLDQIEQAYGVYSIQQLENYRDIKEIAIINNLKLIKKNKSKNHGDK